MTSRPMRAIEMYRETVGGGWEEDKTNIIEEEEEGAWMNGPDLNLCNLANISRIYYKHSSLRRAQIDSHGLRPVLCLCPARLVFPIPDVIRGPRTY